jgi:hypothetical protein
MGSLLLYLKYGQQKSRPKAAKTAEQQNKNGKNSMHSRAPAPSTGSVNA